MPQEDGAYHPLLRLATGDTNLVERFDIDSRPHLRIDATAQRAEPEMEPEHDDGPDQAVEREPGTGQRAHGRGAPEGRRR